jgi:uroporphyrinogen III methyltransferase/synthase
MGMRRIEQITAALIDGGRAESTPAAVIQWGARPEQRVGAATLGTIATRVREAGVTNPAVIIVGEVVNLRSEVSWYDRQPLFGKRILVLRPSGQAALTAAEIRRRGAEPIVFPVIELIDPPDPTPAERALERLDSYDWVLFTSANGVDRFFALLARRGRDARALARARVGVIGPKTAEAVERHAIRPDLVADEFVAERLARAILEHEHVTRVLLARALVARDVLPETLRQAGIEVDIAPVYATRTAGPERAAELNERFEKGSVDIVIFTASSTVTALVSMLDDRARQLLGSLTLAAIGPVTAATLAEQGLPVTVSAESYTIYGLLDALERYFSCSVPSASRR